MTLSHVRVRAWHEWKVRDLAFRAYARAENLRRRQRGFIINPYQFTTGDPYFASVSLLLHLNGPDGSLTITDNSGTPKSCVVNNSVAIETDNFKWGGASAFANFTAQSSNNLQVSHHADLNLPGDNTLELWCRWAASPTAGVYSPLFFTKQGVTGLDYEYGFGLIGTNLLEYDYTTDGTTFGTPTTATFSPSTNTWYHIAACRDANNMRLFVDGTQVGSTGTVTGAVHSSSQDMHLVTDAINNSTFNGYLDDARITKGVARYTTNFTAPAAQFQDS